jgi:hypothetical protein
MQATEKPKLHIFHTFIRANLLISFVSYRYLTADLLITLIRVYFLGNFNPSAVVNVLQALRSTGLRKTDPRLAEMMDNLREVHKKSGHEGGSPETQKLDRETFKRLERN